MHVDCGVIPAPDQNGLKSRCLRHMQLSCQLLLLGPWAPWRSALVRSSLKRGLASTPPLRVTSCNARGLLCHTNTHQTRVAHSSLSSTYTIVLSIASFGTAGSVAVGIGVDLRDVVAERRDTGRISRSRRPQRGTHFGRSFSPAGARVFRPALAPRPCRLLPEPIPPHTSTPLSRGKQRVRVAHRRVNRHQGSVREGSTRYRVTQGWPKVNRYWNLP